MTLRSFRRQRPAFLGFSLIEMLVAVMFVGILTAGMFRIYASNLANFQRVNDTIASQRRGRWALGSLQDDVASIGYFAFVPLNPINADITATAGGQEPFMILPEATPVLVTGPDPANPGAGLVTAPLAPNPDELQFVSDLSLPIQATYQGPAGGILTLNVLSGNLLTDVQPDDIAAILDLNAFQQIKVGTVASDHTIVVKPLSPGVSGSSEAVARPLDGAVTFHPSLTTPVVFFRPSVVTRYSIQARAWDPSNPGITVPCLMRQQTSYLPGGTLINWAGIPTEVIAENIDGFRVDLSFDGGTTWLRQGSASWQAIVDKMAALTPGGKTLNPRDSANPLWFRTFPCLIRMDVTSRSAAPRAENSNLTGQAAYVRRTQTLMITPRNFGLPGF